MVVSSESPSTSPSRAGNLSCMTLVRSPPSSRMRLGRHPSGPSMVRSIAHQNSSSDMPFQANTGTPVAAIAAAAWSWVEKMLHELQRTVAPSAVSVSIRTAVWTVMCRQPAIRAPSSGREEPNSARSAINPGISVSAMAISLRPQSARARLATRKSSGALMDVSRFCRRMSVWRAAPYNKPRRDRATRGRRGRTLGGESFVLLGDNGYSDRDSSSVSALSPLCHCRRSHTFRLAGDVMHDFAGVTSDFGEAVLIVWRFGLGRRLLLRVRYCIERSQRNCQGLRVLVESARRIVGNAKVYEGKQLATPQPDAEDSIFTNCSL